MHVVEVQLGAREAAAAVLALPAISRIHVEPAETNLAPRHAVEAPQEDDAWHPHGTMDEPNRLPLGPQLSPGWKIEGPVLAVDRQRHLAVEQREGAAQRRDVNGQVGSVQ